jgi:hypothetical protein
MFSGFPYGGAGEAEPAEKAAPKGKSARKGRTKK